MIERIIRLLIKCYCKKHNDLIAWHIPIDERTDIDIIVSHYYEDHWTRGTKIFDYEGGRQ